MMERTAIAALEDRLRRLTARGFRGWAVGCGTIADLNADQNLQGVGMRTHPVVIGAVLLVGWALAEAFGWAAGGGELRFTMARAPNTRWPGANAQRQYSMSDP